MTKYTIEIFDPMAWSQEDLENKKKLEGDIIMFDRLASQFFSFDALNKRYHEYRQRSLDAQEELQALIASNNDLNIPRERFHGR